MPDPKRDAIEMLKELVELTILEEGDPQSFRVRAYESAIHGIEAFPGDLGALSAKELQKIKGIGTSTAAKLRELFESGKVTKLEGLRQKHPASVVALMRIPGLGPKAVMRLRNELGVTSTDDLRKAVAENKLRDLRGFGQKSEEKLAAVLERLARDGADKRTPISVALPLAERIVGDLRAIPGVHHAEYCGSLRRFSETVGDLDIVVAADDPAPVMEKLVTLPMIDRVLGRGEKKTSVVTRRGLQIDLRVVAREQLGAALVYFTGSKAHNIGLRMRALERKMTLNEYGLFDVETGAPAGKFATEEDVYASLGLDFIPPVLREDAGEIDLAARHELPRAIRPDEVIGDFHVHTSLSGDGRSSLEEVVAAARAAGYRILAITEHAEGLPINGVSRDGLLQQRAKIEALQKEVGDSIKLLHGIELNIGPNGELDYDLEFRKLFGWCLASVHDHFDLDRAKQTKRVVTAMEDPTVHMIGHLSARMIGSRPPIDLDIPEILAAAERTGTALEINGGLPRLDCSVDVVRSARDRDVTFILTSDAHHTNELSRMRNARLVAHKAWLPPDRVANTWTPERFAGWLA